MPGRGICIIFGCNIQQGLHLRKTKGCRRPRHAALKKQAHKLTITNSLALSSSTGTETKLTTGQKLVGKGLGQLSPSWKHWQAWLFLCGALISHRQSGEEGYQILFSITLAKTCLLWSGDSLKPHPTQLSCLPKPLLTAPPRVASLGLPCSSC